MSLEETAKQAIIKTRKIHHKCREIEHLANMVLTKHKLEDNSTIQFSDEDKQKIIQNYQTKKAELDLLVSELP